MQQDKGEVLTIQRRVHLHFLMTLDDIEAGAFTFPDDAEPSKSFRADFDMCCAELVPLIDAHGANASVLQSKGADNMFPSLTRSIVAQQLAVAAVKSIYGRFLEACKVAAPKSCYHGLHDDIFLQINFFSILSSARHAHLALIVGAC